MDDEFLYRLREAPNAEFAKSLYDQLFMSQTKPDLRSSMHSLISRMNMKSKLVLWVGLMIVGVLLLASISPVRALVQELLTTLAGQSYLVTEDYPGYGDDEQIIEPRNMPQRCTGLFPYSMKLPIYIRMNSSWMKKCCYIRRTGRSFFRVDCHPVEIGAGASLPCVSPRRLEHYKSPPWLN
jgi:hypothetical protein